jgi:NodT family efflux transporter outer membrane factor (OMF) lipoprotein
MKPMRPTLLFLAAATLTACAVGPNYHRPSAPTPTHFKEAEGWKPAEPREAASGTNWWEVYDDATLNGLEKQVDVSNQTLKASEAAWRQAVALAQAAGATIYPAVGVSGTAQRSRGATTTFVTSGGSGGSTSGKRPAPVNEFSLTGNASWDLDIWGKIRRTIESDVASAKASEAELAAARLSSQATLAIDYVELRVADEQIQLLADTIKGYQRALEITQNQYKVGVVAKADVITAETQLEGAQSQQIGLGVTRATLEHAIAVLIGKPPADFSIAPATLAATIPVVPAGMPSALLERRPDIAEAERKMAAANAQIGVAISAYFPDLTLSGTYGFASNVSAGLLRTPNNVWSVGATASDALLDFGARRYQVAGARAAYDGTVANYRQTVLTAFQQVEDELASLRILEQQFQVADQTVKDANLAVTLALNQYRAGTVAYTAVVTAQAIALNDAQTLLNIRQSRLVASLTLIQALGGGWSTSDLSAVHVALPTPL